MWKSFTSKFSFGKKKKSKPIHIEQSEIDDNVKDFERISDEELEYIDFESEEECDDEETPDQKLEQMKRKKDLKEKDYTKMEGNERMRSRSEVKSNRMQPSDLKRIDLKKKWKFMKIKENKTKI